MGGVASLSALGFDVMPDSAFKDRRMHGQHDAYAVRVTAIGFNDARDQALVRYHRVEGEYPGFVRCAAVRWTNVDTL